MSELYFRESSLDDLLRVALEALNTDGRKIRPSKGEALELVGTTMELTNPLARLSRTETRGKLFSCLGELCWYLSGSNELQPIAYYLPKYGNYADNDIVHGGYGPRLFDWNGLNQLENVAQLLRTRLDSRRAVVQLFDRTDIVENYRDVPCTLSLQFMRRDGQLHLCTAMRSNDIFMGLPHDIFCFTMIQELLARSLNLELGAYKHFVGSLHVYSDRKGRAEDFLGEGWQPRDAMMPPMPKTDPWPAVRFLLDAERDIRAGGIISKERLDGVHPYWLDIVHLLLLFRHAKSGAKDAMKETALAIQEPAYQIFVSQFVEKYA